MIHAILDVEKMSISFQELTSRIGKIVFRRYTSGLSLT